MYIGPNYGVGGLPLRNSRSDTTSSKTSAGKASTRNQCGPVTTPSTTTLFAEWARTQVLQQVFTVFWIDNTSGTVKIYNNWIETTGQHGIQVWTAEGPKVSEKLGPFDAYIWNNVIVDAGGLWRPFMCKELWH